MSKMFALASKLYEARIDAACIEYGKMLGNLDQLDELKLRQELRDLRQKYPVIYNRVPKKTVRETSTAKGHFKW